HPCELWTGPRRGARPARTNAGPPAQGRSYERIAGWSRIRAIDRLGSASIVNGGFVQGMTSASFPHLFSPLQVGPVTLKNRIFSTGHDTTLPTNGLINDALVAYHRARAEGGAGLIVVQVAAVHDSARYSSHVLMATSDDCI